MKTVETIALDLHVKPVTVRRALNRWKIPMVNHRVVSDDAVAMLLARMKENREKFCHEQRERSWGGAARWPVERKQAAAALLRALVEFEPWAVWEIVASPELQPLVWDVAFGLMGQQVGVALRCLRDVPMEGLVLHRHDDRRWIVERVAE